MPPYGLQIGQELSAADKITRIAFAQVWKKNLKENPNFLQRIAFSDKLRSALHGAGNKRNCRV